jgi:hypothetical protein
MGAIHRIEINHDRETCSILCCLRFAIDEVRCNYPLTLPQCSHVETPPRVAPCNPSEMVTPATAVDNGPTDRALT